MHGESEGVELTQTWEVFKRWRINSAYSWLNLQLHLDPSSGDTFSEAQERQSPQHQVQLRSEFDVSRRVQFDTSVYHVGSLPALSVPAYTRIDARLGWRLSSAVEINLGGQNLQGGRHLEYVSEGPFAPSRVGRSFYARVAWRFE
jgi:iron complex outermembrane receptor protein